PSYRRLRHVRYADDVLLGFAGPKAEAEQIKAELGRFLRETLKLELNPAKTLITHARTRRASVLGYDITVQHSNTKITRNKRSPGGTRTANGKIALLVPPEVIRAKCAPYRKHGKPWHRTRLQNLDDYDIVRTYGAEYRGIASCYLLAPNPRSPVTKRAPRHRATIGTSDGQRTCYEARKKREGRKDLVARFGGIPL